MPEGKHFVTANSKLMTVAEIEQLASVFISLGVNKIRLTGGEPLLRKDINDIIRRLSSFPAELTITTNAFFADEYIDIFREAGINSVNVSLDSLNPDEFSFITKRDHFNKIFSNICLLLENEFKLKVNFVVMKEINDKSILDFIEWTKDFPLEVRFIEFMPFDKNNWNIDKVLSYDEILNLIGENYEFEKIEDEFNDTSRKFRADGHLGTFGIISTVTNHFCVGCNRLRLTSDGKLKNCLFSKDEIDLLTPLRNGDDILSLITSCLNDKAAVRGGQFETDTIDNIVNRSMVSIGG